MLAERIVPGEFGGGAFDAAANGARDMQKRQQRRAAGQI